MVLSSTTDRRAYKIKRILVGDLKLKLLEMGFLAGQPIQISRVAPFGDPIAVRVENQIIMLRKGEADLIELEST